MSKNDDLTNEELLSLDHNNHSGAFRGYLNQSRHYRDKLSFLRGWVKPKAEDSILECGSSSGRTSIDFSKNTECYCLGVDFDPEAVAVSISGRDKYFPELIGRCDFVHDDLENMIFKKNFTKVVMPDFSEHIPDRVFIAILANIKKQLRNTALYIYTPNRSHIFEILKHNNLILRNSSGHINVKSHKQLVEFLENNGWKILSSSWRVSAIPVVKYFESVFGYLPFVGKYFQRRVMIIAKPG